jgi:GT2 family glycosyltransferase
MSHTAVVILNYNGEKLMKQFLPSVTAYSGSAEVIVADNGSNDGSLAMLKEEFPGVRVISLPKNYGFCGGYNESLKQVKADYYVLLNSDVEVTPNWLEPMVALLDKHPDIAAVQPKILSYYKQNLFEYAGAGGGYIDAFGYPFCRGRIFDTVEEDHGQYNNDCSIFWATGACMMIRSEVYHQFGGLDEDFFAHMEEIDLCWKIHRTGKKLYYTGASTVYHVGAGTLGYDSPRKTYLNFRNNLALLLKHFDTRELLWKLPFRFLLDWFAAFVFVVKGKAGNGGAIIEAHWYFLTHLGMNLRKRRSLHTQYPHYDRGAVYKSLLIMDYHLKSGKTFDALDKDKF